MSERDTAKHMIVACAVAAIRAGIECDTAATSLVNRGCLLTALAELPGDLPARALLFVHARTGTSKQAAETGIGKV